MDTLTAYEQMLRQREQHRAQMEADTAKATMAMMKSGQQAAQGILGGQLTPRPSRLEQLCVRLRVSSMAELGLKLQIIEDNGIVFSFVVSNGKYVVIEDTPEMFPCDQTVTQIRMLLNQ